MAYIETGLDHKGIRALIQYKSSTGAALMNLAEALLHGPSPIPKKEREIIAAYTSKLNHCEFCYESHRAAAIAHYEDEIEVACILENINSSTVSRKLSTLLSLVELVQKSGQLLTVEEINRIKERGITDEEIHDTVLITAAFCMFNRYVDGLGARKLEDKKDYIPMGKHMAENGYGKK